MEYRSTIPPLAAATLLALTTGAWAQGFGGSFDDGGATGGAGVPPPAVTAPPPPASGGGDFGGSFGGDFGGGGGVAAAPPVSPPPPATGGGAVSPPLPPGPTPGGSDFGDGGAFNPDAGKPIAAPPPPAVRPPTVQPPVSAPPPVDNQLVAFELRDFGVPPTSELRQGQFHGPTPTSIPGAQVVTTAQLAQAMQGGMQLVLIDVLGGDYTLPNALKAPALASPGSFGDGIQQQAGQWLRQITQGNTGMPVVIYCSDPQCWLSYNAVLRSVAAGFGNVYWYRGGLQAWQMAGFPLSVGGF